MAKYLTAELTDGEAGALSELAGFIGTVLRKRCAASPFRASTWSCRSNTTTNKKRRASRRSSDLDDDIPL
jgi:hypothetical protein